ncbi:unnamed protein product [Thlaspi arvense]|uniref:DUF4283 domain-containing protein n=1 Tax=Thlaspi arvense TaxID=13288 RepID=A0AAU9S5J2_THLAR|nr:unnamed protein product [Thlaspi arvense]
MAHRYSTAEKGKWIPVPSQQERRTPIKIPESDNSTLIEENKLTLIGRVMNPLVQKPHWVVEWLSQFWNLNAAVVGRPLGPDLFSFKFETEEDLANILRKSPYHYKRWMLVLQRWEPVISNDYPSSILFWVRIHGVPLHYWQTITFHSIGKALGRIVDEDIPEGRLRLELNGLKPLEMKLPISIPSGEVIWITLEYEKLEKHCFHCYSLMHEEKECPLKPANTTTEQTTRGINQLNTVSTLEEYRRRNQNRLGDLPPRRPEASQNREISSYHHRDLQPRERDQSRSDNRRDYSPRKSRVLEERLRYPPHWDSHRNASREYNRLDDRASSRGDSRLHLKERTPQYFRPIARNDKEPSSKAGSKSENADITSPPRFISDIQGNLHRTTPQPSQRTQISHTPSPTPLREPMLLPSHTEVGEGIIPSAQRRSALDIISSQSPPVPPRSHEGSSLLSERLQEVKIQYDEIIGDKPQGKQLQPLKQ